MAMLISLLSKLLGGGAAAGTGGATTAATAAGVAGGVAGGELITKVIQKVLSGQLTSMVNTGAQIPFTTAVIPGQLTSRQLGQQTGRGTGEGFNRYMHAIALGINPFDAVSEQMAREIAFGVAQKGFHGKIADAMMNSVGDIVNKIGIDWQKGLEAANFAVRQGGVSLRQFNAQMQDLHEITRTTGGDINTVAGNFMQAQLATMKQGGAESYLSTEVLSRTIQRQYPQYIGQAGHEDQFQGLHGAIQQMGMLQGIAPWNVSTDKGKKAGVGVLEDRVKMLRQMAKQMGMGLPEYARYMAYTGLGQEMFGLTDAEAIQEVLEHSKRISTQFTQSSKKVATEQVKGAAEDASVKVKQDFTRAAKGLPGYRFVPTAYGKTEKDQKKVRDEAFKAGAARELKRQETELGVKPTFEQLQVALKLDAKTTMDLLSGKYISLLANRKGYGPSYGTGGIGPYPP